MVFFLLFSLWCYSAMTLMVLLATGLVLVLVAHRLMQQVNGLLSEVATARTLVRSLFPRLLKPISSAVQVQVKSQHWLDLP